MPHRGTAFSLRPVDFSGSSQHNRQANTQRRRPDMLRALSRPATRLMERWLPDAFIFVLVLLDTIVAARCRP